MMFEGLSRRALITFERAAAILTTLGEDDWENDEWITICATLFKRWMSMFYRLLMLLLPSQPGPASSAAVACLQAWARSWFTTSFMAMCHCGSWKGLFVPFAHTSACNTSGVVFSRQRTDFSDVENSCCASEIVKGSHWSTYLCCLSCWSALLQQKSGDPKKTSIS